MKNRAKKRHEIEVFNMNHNKIMKIFALVWLVCFLFFQPVYAEEWADVNNTSIEAVNSAGIREVNRESENEVLAEGINMKQPRECQEEEGRESESGFPEQNGEESDIVLYTGSQYLISVVLDQPQNTLVLEEDKLVLYPNSTKLVDIKANTNNLQAVIDAVADAGGGSVTIPIGTYYFYPASRNFDKEGSILTSEDVNYVDYYVIKCRDHVTVNGTLNADGTLGTVLSPIANLAYPVDMFYHADLIDRVADKYDTSQAKWLENADFNDFTIDYSNTVNYGYYNAKGKGFFIVLLKDCDWNNVTVKYTDGTGFGVDCPINCTIKNCTAVACGKQATSESVGGSGFGIGFGYSNEESMLIENCLSTGNRKFGFFFENQARFEAYYQAATSKGFTVKNCVARGNQYNYGGEMCSNTYYIDCVSDRISSIEENPLNITNKSAYYFGTESTDYHIVQNGTEINKYVANKEYYTDVSGWFVTEGWFEKILTSEIMYGYVGTDGQLTYVFGQEDPVTRGQVALMLYRYCYPGRNIEYVENATPFIDNISSAYYTEAMNWAYEQGIFTGYRNADGSLGKYIKPNSNITREELATVFCRFAEKNGADIVNYDTQAYKNALDANAVSFWAKDTVAWCYSNRIMTGGGVDKLLKPQNQATRCEAAKMILQMFETLK